MNTVIMRHLPIRFQILLLVFVIVLSGCASNPPKDNIKLAEDLPEPFVSRYYKVDPYIRAASILQSLGRPDALQKLHVMASDGKSDDKVIVLCRMLFTERPGSNFRRPMIGGASFLGDTDYSDWPLEPIELVDGIPFLITRGYFLAGDPEPSAGYLRYCETNCDWSAFHYAAKSEQQKREALRKLVTSPKWKRPLNTAEQQFLSAQIE